MALPIYETDIAGQLPYWIDPASYNAQLGGIRPPYQNFGEPDAGLNSTTQAPAAPPMAPTPAGDPGFADPTDPGGGPVPDPGQTDPGTIGSYAQYSGPAAPDYSFYQPGGPDYSRVGAAPTFNWSYAGGPFSYDAFSAPTQEQASNDPGYQFALKQGNQALTNRASAMGGLRTGGTIKDFINYNQAAAAQQYGSVFDRDFNSYQANRNNAFGNYTTNYNNAYQSARDAYTPQLEDWRQKSAAQINGANMDWQTGNHLGEEAANSAFDRAWQAYTYGQPSATDIYRSGL